MKIRKTAVFAMIISLLAALITGCGGADTAGDSGDLGAENGLDKITVQSLWLPQGQFAGLYAAEAKGFYEEEGIDVEILPGGTDVSSEDQVENDVAQVGVAFYSSVLTYQEGGYDFINVFQTFRNSPQYLVAKAESGIKTGKDLKGKKVGSWFGGRQYEFYALAQLNGLDPEKDIEWKQQDYTMDQFISGELDVASAMSYNEYLLLLENGFNEEDLNVIDMNKEGAAMLEDCLFVKRSWAEENRDLLVRFIRATIKGWKYVAENPEEAAQIVYEAGKNSTLEHQIAMTEKVLESVIPEGSDESQIGYPDEKSILQTIDLGLQSGLIKSRIDINDSIDTSYWEEAAE
ncbi:MAG: ABC transporter substrate-binding protein [Bacillota bacterium]|nr:ABC transporter substrate-binding protein [Bacillota bacterium]